MAGIYGGIGRGIEAALNTYLGVSQNQKALERQKMLDERQAALDAETRQTRGLEHDLALKQLGLQERQFNDASTDRFYNRTKDRLGSINPNANVGADLAADADKAGLGDQLTRTPAGTLNAGTAPGLGPLSGMLPFTNVMEMISRTPTTQERLGLQQETAKKSLLDQILDPKTRAAVDAGVSPAVLNYESPEQVRAAELKNTVEKEKQTLPFDLQKIAATAAGYQSSRGTDPADKWAQEYNRTFDNERAAIQSQLGMLPPGDPRAEQLIQGARKRAETSANGLYGPRASKSGPTAPAEDLEAHVDADLQSSGGNFDELLQHASSPEGKAAIQSAGYDPAAYVRKLQAMKVLAKLSAK